MDSGDGEINGANQNVQLRFRPLLHLVERFEHYAAVGPEMSLLRDTIMRGLFNEFSLETAIEIFYNTLGLGNIDDIARVDLALQATGIGLNPAVGAEGPWDNEALPAPAADMENNLAGLAEDHWDHQGLHLPSVNVDINLPREEDQFADDMWWVWESDIDSGAENESDLESESEDEVPELIPVIPEPQESGSPPRERADESDLFGSRRRQREENNNGESNEMNRKRLRFLESGNEPSDTTSESEDNENEDTVSSPSTSADTEAGQKKRKRDDDDEDNGRDKKMCKK
ncbi:unnamed protein product [Oreochromis niloticus]|nr:unnamed protein product [Mustela putorius furo]